MMIQVETSPSAGDVRAAAHLFDDAPDDAATSAFLADDRHHLLIASIDGQPAGFVSAVELLHPDKPRPEMFLYELGVDERYRRRGVATALLATLVALCRTRGCGEMFVITEGSNDAALAAYQKADAVREADSVMLHWQFTEQR